MKPRDLISHLVASIPHKLQTLIVGPPGGGKTAIFWQACAAVGADPILWHPSVADPTDFKGMPAVTNNGTEAHFLPFGDLMRIIHATKLTAVLVDDLGQAPHSVQAALMQLLHGGRLNGHTISEHVVFIGATNDTSHRAGVNSILEPVKSRFHTIVKLEPDLDDWVDWALKHDLPPELIAFIRFRPGLLSDFQPSRELTNTPSPRTVHAVGKWVKIGKTDFETISGAAGQGFAAEFIGFLRVFQSLPSIEQILREPTTAPVPREPSGLYAVTAALARRFTAKNAAPIFTYATRLPKEFEVCLILDARRLHPEITGTKPFIDWAIRNAGVLN